MPDWIPSRLADFKDFQKDFNTAVQANGATWGVSVGDMTELQNDHDKFEFYYPLAADKATRTKQDIDNRNFWMGKLKKKIRQIAAANLRFNPILSDADFDALHMTKRDNTKTAAPVPGTDPTMRIKPETGSTLAVYFHQEEAAPGTSKRKKPKGVGRFELRYALTEAAPVAPEDCPLLKSSGRSPIRLTFSPADAGKHVYMFGRWVNTRNAEGRWTQRYVAVVPV